MKNSARAAYVVPIKPISIGYFYWPFLRVLKGAFILVKNVLGLFSSVEMEKHRLPRNELYVHQRIW